MFKRTFLCALFAVCAILPFSLSAHQEYAEDAAIENTGFGVDIGVPYFYVGPMYRGYSYYYPYNYGYPYYYQW